MPQPLDSLLCLTSRLSGQNKQGDTAAACTFSKDGDVIMIAIERGYDVTYPLKCPDLIE